MKLDYVKTKYGYLTYVKDLIFHIEKIRSMWIITAYMADKKFGEYYKAKTLRKCKQHCETMANAIYPKG